MQVKSILMLMAATLAPMPLFAQEPAPAAVAVPAPVPSAISPLSLIPADAEAAFILTNAGQRVQQFHGESVRAKAIGSIAVGAAKGNARLVADLATLKSLAMVSDIQGLFLSFSRHAMDSTPIRGTQAKMHATAAGLALHPVYCVVSIPEGQEAFVQSELKELEGEIRKATAGKTDREFVSVGGLFGAKFTIPHKQTPARKFVSGEDVMRDAVAQALESRTVYMLIGMKDGHVVGVACENPEEIAFATTPEQSLLGTKAWQRLQPNLQDDVIFAASVTPDLLAQAGQARMNTLIDGVSWLSGHFSKLAANTGVNTRKLEAASTGAKTIATQLGAMVDSMTVEQPIFLQIWETTGAYHVEFSCDAGGATFSPAKLALEDRAALADTIFCVEGTPFRVGSRIQLPGGKAMATATWDVVQGTACILPAKFRAKATGALAKAEPFLPELASTGTALQTMADGLTGTTGLVIDAAADFPRVAFYSGVADRGKLAQGWDALLQTAGDVLEKCGKSRAYARMLPIIPAELDGGATGYSLYLPGLTPGLSPNATVSDTAIAIGSSSALNKELVSATGNTEFAGIRFTLNTEPLARSARKIAAKLGAARSRHANDAVEIAQNLAYFAAFVKEVQGRITIQDGVETLRLDINLNQDKK